MSAIVVEARSTSYVDRVKRGTGRALLFVVVLAALWGLWEGYRWLWLREGWTWPFVVDQSTMPHIHDVLRALFRDSSSGTGGKLIEQLLRAARFTGKEAAVGFGLGAGVGFVLGIVLSQSRLLRRGFLPYVVASQTVPILAVAPIVVVYLGTIHVAPWFSVAVIAAYLTFFPVTISTLRGVQSADRRALELMRSYAAGRWTVLWKLRVPTALPFIFAALKVSATASVVGAIIGELPSGIQDGLGGKILVFNQYYTLDPTQLWATNIIAAFLGIAFFLVILLVERVAVRRAPENVA
ncbi:MAG: NitT/TauT family transport system permease protein [Gaiellaceae bacterium]|nr:NitT/TauT family transport system permease protein [Gaiellaceae bacterium]